MPKGLCFLLIALISMPALISSARPSNSQDTERTSSSARYYYEKGREQYLLLTPSNLRSAIDYFKRSLEIEENFAPSYAAASEAYSFLGFLSMEEREDYEEPFNAAHENVLKALRLEPNSYLTQRALALTFLHLHRKSDSREAAKRALELKPDDPESLYVLWEATGANPDSPLIKRALEINPNLVMAHLGLGKSYLYKKRDYAKSASHWREAVRVSPDFDFAHTYLGTALRSEGKLGGAVEAYLRALEINPDNASAYMNLGIAQIYMGKPEAAIANERKAISLNPKLLETYYYLGRGYEISRNYAQAETLYQKFLELASNRDRYAQMAEEARKKIELLNGAAE